MSNSFYKLSNSEWMRAIHQLKPASLKILFYLRTLDPFGDRGIEMRIAEIGAAVNLGRSTVSRSLSELRAGEWIDLEVTAVKIKIKGGPKIEAPGPKIEAPLPKNEAPGPKIEAPLPKNEAPGPKNEAPLPKIEAPGPKNEAPLLKNEAPLLKNEAPTAPKPTQDENPGTPQTNPDFTDFTDSLSEETRESFLKFCNWKIGKGINGQIIACPDRWLAKHWPSYWAEFNEKYGEAVKAQQKQQEKPEPLIEGLEEAIASGLIEEAEGDRYRSHGIWLEKSQIPEWLQLSPEQREEKATSYREKIAKLKARMSQMNKGSKRS